MGAQMPKARKQEGAGRRTEEKDNRRHFMAGLFRKGIPISEIYRVMCGKFQVTEQTVRKDIKALGLASQRHLDNAASVAAEIEGAVSRLKARARRDDSVGNRADEMLLNIWGNRSARVLQANLQAQKLRLQTAQEDLTLERTRLTRLQATKAELEMGRNGHAQDEFRALLDGVSNQGQVGFGDIVSMTTLLIKRELEAESGPDVGRVSSFLHLLYRIAEANPPTDLSGQHFLIPENLFDSPPDDQGDELLAQ
jgi:hypothetical protein